MCSSARRRRAWRLSLIHIFGAVDKVALLLEGFVVKDVLQKLLDLTVKDVVAPRKGGAALPEGQRNAAVEIRGAFRRGASRLVFEISHAVLRDGDGKVEHLRVVKAHGLEHGRSARIGR